MHMLLARSAFTRGMQLVAGMLSVVTTQDAIPERSRKASEFSLVSWTSNARSRREDELARSRERQIES
jgi:hypothetical protein